MARRFGSIRLLASGRLQATYSHPWEGRQVARSFDSRVEAERWLSAERQGLECGHWQEAIGSRTKLAEYFVDWLAGRPLAPRTVDLYRMLWRLHIAPTLGQRRLNELSPTHVRRWHAGLLSSSVGRTTIAKSYRLLSVVTGDAMRDGLMARPVCLIRGAGSERAPEMRCIGVAEILQLAAAMPPHLRALILVAGFGGLRWGELAGLAVNQVDSAAGTVRVEQALQETSQGLLLGPPKTTAARRTVHLPPSVVASLVDHLELHRPVGPWWLVFTTENHRPLRRPNFTATWRTATQRADLQGLRFHDLRHSAATLATTGGATIREVQARLGHSTPSAAMRYQHASTDRDRGIADRLEVVVNRLVVSE
ncbi:MAG: tyrosine-type recombinase/integrase [Actinomycetes bacterium]|jgi:integrase